jgi:hypothetical protein
MDKMQAEKKGSRKMLPTVSSVKHSVIDNDDTYKVKKQIASLVDDVPSELAKE